MTTLREIAVRNRAGERIGITSICSAHPLVIEAAALEAAKSGERLLVEATSNQVDQYGGYTGMTPADFRRFVEAIVERCALPSDRLILGGDHLGPNRWQDRSPDVAMREADVQIEAYARAGFRKIHLDCSMSCAGDPTPLGDRTVAERAARLAAVAEQAAGDAFGASSIEYVIGTEVPVPGGARESLDHGVVPTEPSAARATVAAHREAFAARGLRAAWERVVALVVQPGLEFDHTQVLDYRRAPAAALAGSILDEPDLVFEAHSTDYQTGTALAELVEDHFAILKVGPGLTFALREALFALDSMEAILVREGDRSGLRETVDRRMREAPTHWASHYHGTEAEIAFARAYSLSDRIRYYWPDPAVRAAEETLFANLGRTGIPLPLLSQFLPDQFRRVRDGTLSAEPKALVLDKIADVNRLYADACRPPIQEKPQP